MNPRILYVLYVELEKEARGGIFRHSNPHGGLMMPLNCEGGGSTSLPAHMAKAKTHARSKRQRLSPFRSEHDKTEYC